MPVDPPDVPPDIPPDNPPDVPPDPPVTPTPTVSSAAYGLQDMVTGVEPNTTVADFIAALTVTDGTAKVFATDGTTEKAEGILATGDILNVYDNDGTVCITLPVILYGDVNGDGKINSQDLRRAQRHILGVGAMEGHPLTAADVNRDGKVNSQDLRQTQRHILGLTTTLQPAPAAPTPETPATPTPETGDTN